MQTQCVQEGGERLHDHEHGHRHAEPHRHAEQRQVPLRLDRVNQQHVPEHRRQLRVREGQRPESQVGGGVGHGAEHELDRLDQLVDHELAKLELLAVVAVTAVTALAVRGLFLGLALRVRVLAVLVVLVDDHVLVAHNLVRGLALVVAVAQHERLDEQHDGDGEQRDHQQHELRGLLAREQVLGGALVGRRQEHVNQHVEQGGGALRAFRRAAKLAQIRRAGVIDGLASTHQIVLHVGHEPLVDDEEAEVAEDGEHEQELRNELEGHVQVGAEVERVQQLHEDAEHHLRDTEQNGHFHLERVVVAQLVLGTLRGRRSATVLRCQK